ncbi:MAG: UDP-N-acetylmuramoyl-tripeptide--D-alanyl-D-alanine ligase [Parcubacteria group bacterium]|nr:MAG: UDP-N-acetylmuramoyl-tripeptide--D-alanyl-D-alanine ligase [Parcubacteria group bacterium]
MKKLLYFKLKILARLVLARYKPKIIGITGSVGKTSAREAIFCVLREDFKVRRNVKNFNNEIGVPLTILLAKANPGKNIFRWLFLFLSACGLLIFKSRRYPRVLVLEMAADRPGDIDYLSSIAQPDIAVITAIGPSHIEYFGSIKNIIREKSSILKKLGTGGWAIINFDDENLKEVIKNCKCRTKTFGQGEGSDVQVTNIKISQHQDQYGTSFKLRSQGSETPMFLPGVLGWQHAQAAAAAAAVGLAMGMNIVRIGERLGHYVPARGRTNLIPGIKKTWIIDDTYNASPQSAKAALQILHDMPANGSRIAIFGDMLELGAHSEQGHQEVGRLAAQLGIDYLYVFGERSRDIARGAREAGMDEDKIYHFPFVVRSGQFVQERVKPGDVILVKGSRGSKMEQMVFEIMAKPWEASEVLVGKVQR